MTSQSHNSSSNNNGQYMSVNSKGGAQKRIRTPSTHDILLGRGGGINSHVGNRIFREWVRERKEDYNLAPNKIEKTQVAKEVMEQVKARNGRFLQRLTGSGEPGFWIEVDELRALAKTSQALREGAPQIRAAHQPSAKPSTTTKRKRRGSSRTSKPNFTSPQTSMKEELRGVPQSTDADTTAEWPSTVPGVSPELSSTSAPAPTVGPLVDEASKLKAMEELREHLEEAKEQQSPKNTFYRPLMSNSEFQQQQQQQQQQPVQEDASNPSSPSSPNHPHKRPHLVVEQNLDETPTLTSIPTLPHELPPWRLLDADYPKKTVPAPTVPPPPVPKRQKLDHRTHSLAISGDESASQGLADDFVNPFEDETDAVQMANQAASKGRTSSTSTNTPTGTPTPRSLVRNVSSGQGSEEIRRMGEMYEWNNSKDNSSKQYSNQESSRDFYEELRQVMDAVHPDLTTVTTPPPQESGKGHPFHWDEHHDDEENEDGSNMPTLLMPFRPSILSRRYGSSNSLQHQKNKSGSSNGNQSSSSRSNGRSVSPHEGDVVGPAQQ